MTTFTIYTEKRPAGDQFWVFKNGTAVAGHHYSTKLEAERVMADMKNGTSRFAS